MLRREVMKMGAGLFGLGAGTPSRFPYASRPQPSPAVGPSSAQVVRANRVIVTGPNGGIFVYSGTPAPGNLIESIGIVSAGLDPSGLNAVLPGDTRYHNNGAGVYVAQQSTQSYVAFLWQATSPAGPYTQMGTYVAFANEFTAEPLIRVVAPLTSIAGAAPGGSTTQGIIFVPPSGDTTGATDHANLATALTLGAVQLLPGTYYVNAVLEFPGGAVIRGPGPQVTIIRATTAMNAVMASTGWNGSVNTTSQLPVHLSGFRVDANANATHGLVSQNFWSYFEDLECTNSNGGDDFRFDAFGANGTTVFGAAVTAVENHVTDCQFRTPGTGGACFRSHDEVAHQHFTDGWFTDNVCQGSGSSGTVALVQIDVLAGWKVTGNHLYGAAVNAMSGQRMFNTRVTDNYIEPWGTTATAGGYAGMSFDGIADGGFGGSVIANNALNVDATSPGNAASTIDGIFCRVTTGNTGELTITGNSVSNPEPVAAKYKAAFDLQTQAAATTMNVATTGNIAGSGWTAGVLLTLNGGTINHSAGI